MDNIFFSLSEESWMLLTIILILITWGSVKIGRYLYKRIGECISIIHIIHPFPYLIKPEYHIAFLSKYDLKIHSNL